MAQAVGIDPATQATVPFNLINESWAYSLEDIVLKAVRLSQQCRQSHHRLKIKEWISGGSTGRMVGSLGDAQGRSRTRPFGVCLLHLHAFILQDQPFAWD